MDNDTKLAVEAPREVAVGRIERELRALWAQAPLQREAGGSALVRACALNMVAVLWNKRDVQRILDVLLRVAGNHPARTIVVTADPAAAPELRSWISVQCPRPHGGGARVCQELIRIAIGGAEVQHLDTVIMPLLIADLPRFLWWDGLLPDTPREERAFGRLATNCERLILDTWRLRDPLMEIVAIAQLLSGEEYRVSVGDLNWHRLTTWRQVVAQCFDPPDLRPHLFRMQRVCIEYGAGTDRLGVPVQTLFLMGWLGSRLGWRPRGRRDGDGVQIFDFAQDGRPIEVQLKAVPQPAVDDVRIHTVRMEAPGAQVVLRMLPDGSLESAIEAEGRSPLARVVAGRPLDLAAVLDLELSILSRNPVYEAALHMVENLCAMSLHAQAA